MKLLASCILLKVKTDELSDIVKELAVGNGLGEVEEVGALGSLMTEDDTSHIQISIVTLSISLNVVVLPEESILVPRLGTSTGKVAVGHIVPLTTEAHELIT